MKFVTLFALLYSFATYSADSKKSETPKRAPAAIVSGQFLCKGSDGYGKPGTEGALVKETESDRAISQRINSEIQGFLMKYCDPKEHHSIALDNYRYQVCCVAK